MRRPVRLAGVAVLAAFTFPTISAAAIVGTTQLHLSPTHAGMHTNVVARFRQPLRGGMLPSERFVERLVLSGPTGANCAGDAGVSVALDAPGTTIRETLRPGRMTGGRWCVGVHHVALTVSQYSTCTDPTRGFCPEYVVIPRTVATASFRVTRG